MNNPMNDPIDIIMQLLMGGGNPQQAIQQIASQNPRAQVLLNQMQQSGMTPKQFAMQYAKQKRLNIQPLVNMVAQKGIKL